MRVTALAAAALLSFAAAPARAVEAKHEGPPTLVLTPILASLRYPFQAIGLGARVLYRHPEVVHLSAALLVGRAFDDFADGTTSSVWLEGFAGLHVKSWDSRGEAAAPIAETTHHELVVEAGAISAPLTFMRLVRADEQSGVAIAFDRRVTLLGAGVRWLRSWSLSDADDRPRARRLNTYYAQALIRGTGSPEGLFVQDDAFGRQPPQTNSAVGFRLGAQHDLWRTSPIPVDLELGWLPGGVGAYFAAGLTIPLTVL